MQILNSDASITKAIINHDVHHVSGRSYCPQCHQGIQPCWTCCQSPLHIYVSFFLSNYPPSQRIGVLLLHHSCMLCCNRISWKAFSHCPTEVGHVSLGFQRLPSEVILGTSPQRLFSSHSSKLTLAFSCLINEWANLLGLELKHSFLGLNVLDKTPRRLLLSFLTTPIESFLQWTAVYDFALGWDWLPKNLLNPFCFSFPALIDVVTNKWVKCLRVLSCSWSVACFMLACQCLLPEAFWSAAAFCTQFSLPLLCRNDHSLPALVPLKSFSSMDHCHLETMDWTSPALSLQSWLCGPR